MHQINEIFACVESLRLLADAEEGLADHPAREGHHAAMGYISGLIADRLEVIGQDMDERDWKPTLDNMPAERAATH